MAGASTLIITGVERDEQVRLPKARDLGIDCVVNVDRTDLATTVAQLTGGEGADVVVELSGAIPAIHQTFYLARPLGRVAIIGQPPDDKLAFPYREALFRALTVTFNFRSKLRSW